MSIGGVRDLKDVKITEFDAYLFGQGTNYKIYEKMGAHLCSRDGEAGCYFAVWAPTARDVFVVGDFNGWSGYGYDMKPVSDGGIYDLFVPGV